MNESKKMLEIIHNNCKQEREIRQVKEELKNKKEKRARRIELTIIVVALIGLLTVYGLYKDKQVKDCMSGGYSETFCRYAGE